VNQTWKRIFIFLYVKTIGVFSTLNNIFSLVLKCLLEFGGTSLDELGGKLANMGFERSNVFQSNQACVIIQFKERVESFFLNVRCFNHKTNLVVVNLLELDLVC
jgi:hypothetical protein